MRVRLRVQPGDFGDIEFESFTGMVAVLDGMEKSLTNNDWISGDLTEGELAEALAGVDQLRKIFEQHIHHDSEAIHDVANGHTESEITLAYRPVTMQPLPGDGLV